MRAAAVSRSDLCLVQYELLRLEMKLTLCGFRKVWRDDGLVSIVSGQLEVGDRLEMERWMWKSRVGGGSGGKSCYFTRTRPA